jgi:hypothetical protein
VSIGFPASDVCLCAAQAGTVALPVAFKAPALARLRKHGLWGLAPLAAIVGAVVALRAITGMASAITYVSLALIPPLAALALAKGIRRGSLPLALLVVPLFLLAWLEPETLPGQLAAVLLSILACVALAGLIVQLAPLRWLKIGILLMALADVAMVGAQYLQPAQDLLNSAAPAFDLPAFQRVLLSGVVMGFGDFFIAAMFGAVLAVQRVRQDRAALLTFGLALTFDLLFLAVPVIPATVPVAMALLWIEMRNRRARATDGVSRPPRYARS